MLSPRRGQAARLDDRLGVVGVGVQHRRADRLGDVGGVQGRPPVTGRGREADLVVDHQVDGALGREACTDGRGRSHRHGLTSCMLLHGKLASTGLLRLSVVPLCVTEAVLSTYASQRALDAGLCSLGVWLTWHIGHLQQLGNEPLASKCCVAVNEQSHDLPAYETT